MERRRKLIVSNFLNLIATAGGVGGGAAGTTEATWLPLEIHNFADFDGTYQEVLVDTNAKEYISITNYSNEPVFFSRDGLLPNGVVGPNGGSVTLGLGSNGKTENGSIWIRELLATPTDGDVYISAYY